VRNLCAGGSITLYRARVLFNDPDTIQYSYISTGKFGDGSLGRQQSQTFSMFSGQVNAQNYTWEIQLQKVYNQP